MSSVPGPADTLEDVARMVEMHPAPTAVVSLATGRLLAVNEAMLALAGQSREAAIGHPFPASCFEDIPGSGLVFGLPPGAGGLTGPRRIRRHDGRELELLTVCEPATLQGEPVMLASFIDVTAALEDARRLSRAERIHAALAEHSFDAVGAVAPDGRIVYASPSARTVTGYAPEELQEISIFELIHPDDQQAAIESLGRALASPGAPESGIFRFRHRSGGWRHCETAGMLVDDEEYGSLVVIHYRDVTESVRAEAELRASNDQFRHMFEMNPMPAALIRDRDGLLLEVNAAFLELAGHKEDDVSGRLNVADFWPVDDERLGIGRMVRAEGAVRNVPLRFRTRSGRDVETLTFADELVVGGERCVLGVAVDVTEARSLERRLLQVEKLDAVARMAVGVAHDFNNVLGVIKLGTGVLGRNLSLDAEAREGVDEIAAAADRAATMTRQLLSFSRSQGSAPRAVDLHQAIDGLASILKPLLGGRVAVHLDLPGDLWPIWADPAQFDQVIMNLAINARDAMGGRGALTIRAANTTVAGGDVPPSGAYVVISVSDTGTGIDEATMVRIFEPFFTTKPPGQGTGLGLASVHGIVTLHRGAITVESQPGAGATFTIHWPRAE